MSIKLYSVFGGKTMKTLVRWNPIREMEALNNAMNHMFERPFVSRRWDSCQSLSGRLALDVSENDDEFVVIASIPGINPDDLEITFDDKALTIKGEIKEEKENHEAHYLLRERRYGTFSRRLSLTTAIKADAIEANYEAGVLRLRLPKAEEAKPKRIAVQVSNLVEG